MRNFAHYPQNRAYLQALVEAQGRPVPNSLIIDRMGGTACLCSRTRDLRAVGADIPRPTPKGKTVTGKTLYWYILRNPQEMARVLATMDRMDQEAAD